MSKDRINLVLNFICLKFKHDIAPLNAQWAVAYSGMLQETRAFEGKIYRKDFDEIRTIHDVRNSIPLQNAIGNLVFQVSEYAEKQIETQYDRPLLLSFPLILASVPDNARRLVPDPGFFMRLWLDNHYAHFDMALAGSTI